MLAVNIRQSLGKKYSKSDKIPPKADGICTVCTTLHR